MFLVFSNSVARPGFIVVWISVRIPNSMPAENLLYLWATPPTRKVISCGVQNAALIRWWFQIMLYLALTARAPNVLLLSCWMNPFRTWTSLRCLLRLHSRKCIQPVTFILLVHLRETLFSLIPTWMVFAPSVHLLSKKFISTRIKTTFLQRIYPWMILFLCIMQHSLLRCLAPSVGSDVLITSNFWYLLISSNFLLIFY